MPSSNIKIKKNTRRIIIKKKDKKKTVKKQPSVQMNKKPKLKIVEKFSQSSKLTETKKKAIKSPNRTKKKLTTININTKPLVNVEVEMPKRTVDTLPPLIETVIIMVSAKKVKHLLTVLMTAVKLPGLEKMMNGVLKKI